MVRNTSVVTPERFARGFTYQDYLAKINIDSFVKTPRQAGARQG